jgi:hypothetical protein
MAIALRGVSSSTLHRHPRACGAHSLRIDIQIWSSGDDLYSATRDLRPGELSDRLWVKRQGRVKSLEGGNLRFRCGLGSL